MDYDKTTIARSYDAGRGYSPAVMRDCLERFSARADPAQIETILDLGCGTGRFSAALAAHFDARVIGIEPSQTMLAEARGKTAAGVLLGRGTGEALPLADGSIDLVFLSMVFHHLADRIATARECRRVLRPGGTVLLRNGTVDQLRSYPFVGLFPGVETVLRDKLITCREIGETFEAAGFTLAHHEAVAHPMAGSWPAYAEKAALRADSILASLPDDAFEAGMTALRAHAAAADPAEAVTVNVDHFAFR